MGKTRLFAVIVAFLIVAILAVLLLPGEEIQPAPKAEEEPLVPVAAARMEIPAYTVITGEMVYLREVPESSVHENDVLALEDVIGCRSLVPIVIDEVIMSNHIMDPDDPENRLAYKIEEGMRAMTVAVDDSSGVCNQIRAGDFVDVVVCVQNLKEEKDERYEADDEDTQEIPNAGRLVAVMHMQNIEVLALDQDQQYAPKQTDTGLYAYREVTLSVPAEDCQKLAWAEYEGRIFLALRAEDDTGRIETEPYGAEQALLKEEG